MGASLHRLMGRLSAPAGLAAALALGACDPPSPQGLLTSTAAQPFGVVSTSVDSGTAMPNRTIVVTFSRPLDRRSIGRRSVRVVREGGRRLPRMRTKAVGRQLLVTPAPGHELPRGAKLRLHLTGRPSHRAIRATDGAELEGRFELAFRVARDRELDAVGPRVVDSSPAHGARAVSPGSIVVVRFSEPIGEGAVAAGDAAALRVNGRRVDAHLHLASDRTALMVRPDRPLPPDAAVEVAVSSWVVDLSGNSLHEDSERSIRFSTKATSLHEITEEFADAKSADVGGTSAAWGAATTPGLLVGTPGRVALGAHESLGGAIDLDAGSRVAFQIVVPGADVPEGFASALRLNFRGRRTRGAVRSLFARVGPVDLQRPEPELWRTLEYARTRPVVTLDAPLDIERAGVGRSVLEVPFEQPLALEEGENVLIHVEIELAPGVRLAAYSDLYGRAQLLQETDEPLLPAAYLLVAGGAARARSRWYDSGIARPRWRGADAWPIDTTGVTVEYQSTDVGAGGRPDARLAGPWENRLELVPARRFVRFRVRFDDAPGGGEPALLDRIVMPYER